MDNVPVQLYRPARKDDFAVDHSLRSLRAAAGHPERHTAESAESGAIGACDVFLKQRQEFLLFLWGCGVPVAAEDEAADPRHVEIGAEQLAEAGQALHRRDAWPKYLKGAFAEH